jgi:hypothetical protein
MMTCSTNLFSRILDAETKIISLANVELRVDALAQAIQRFHEFAHEFARYLRTPDDRYELIPAAGPRAPLRAPVG